MPENETPIQDLPLALWRTSTFDDIMGLLAGQVMYLSRELLRRLQDVCTVNTPETRDLMKRAWQDDAGAWLWVADTAPRFLVPDDYAEGPPIDANGDDPQVRLHRDIEGSCLMMAASFGGNWERFLFSYRLALAGRPDLARAAGCDILGFSHPLGDFISELGMLDEVRRIVVAKNPNTTIELAHKIAWEQSQEVLRRREEAAERNRVKQISEAQERREAKRGGDGTPEDKTGDRTEDKGDPNEADGEAVGEAPGDERDPVIEKYIDDMQKPGTIGQLDDATKEWLDKVRERGRRERERAAEQGAEKDTGDTGGSDGGEAAEGKAVEDKNTRDRDTRDQEKAKRGKGRPHKQMRVLLREAPPQADRDIARIIQRANQVLPQVPLHWSPDPADAAEHLLEEFPWMGEAIEELRGYLVMSSRLAGFMVVPPTVIVGPSGCGKSRFARRFLEVCGLPYTRLGCAGLTDSRVLAGTAKGWASASPSLPVETIMRTKRANAGIILDEIEKAGGSARSGDIYRSLLGMIEQETSRVWFDEALATDLDISRVVWLATANDWHAIPPLLRGRFRKITVGQPRPQDFDTILDGILEDVAEVYGVLSTELPHLDQAALSEMRRGFAEGSLTARQLTGLVRVALTGAAEAEMNAPRN